MAAISGGNFRTGVTLVTFVGVTQHTSTMTDPFLGSEALAAGVLTPYELRSRYVALHKDVYVPQGVELTAQLRAKALWLRSRRRGVLAGYSASAFHGAKWIDADLPAAIIDTNRRRAPGLQVWEERIEPDEICVIEGMRVTTPERTALDLTSRFPLDPAVAAVDALIQATDLKVADVEPLIERYRGRRGMKAARAALDLVDGGAQSPKETWLRLLLIRAGFPRPQTQIAVRNEWGWAEAHLDMGWQDIKVAAEYDGDHHLTSRYHYRKDILRHEKVQHRYGWIVVRVVADDHPADIIRRVGEARAFRA
ncbi:cullin%2C a subunit of E3 ubiquitin ligase [Mycobacterium tuberculosis]|nr:cullin%2C a subunit of E3 ubiquitin ligase [Mycobacterium tuberculosis]